MIGLLDSGRPRSGTSWQSPNRLAAGRCCLRDGRRLTCIGAIQTHQAPGARSEQAATGRDHPRHRRRSLSGGRHGAGVCAISVNYGKRRASGTIRGRTPRASEASSCASNAARATSRSCPPWKIDFRGAPDRPLSLLCPTTGGDSAASGRRGRPSRHPPVPCRARARRSTPPRPHEARAV